MENVRFMDINQKQAEDIIGYHRFLYYEMGKPMISDVEYDLLEKRLFEQFPNSEMINWIGCPQKLKKKFRKRFVRKASKEIMNGKGKGPIKGYNLKNWFKNFSEINWHRKILCANCGVEIPEKDLTNTPEKFSVNGKTVIHKECNATKFLDDL